MNKYNLTIFTRFSMSVDIEAESKEEAEEKLWDMYNAEEIDPMDANDIETNIEFNHETKG